MITYEQIKNDEEIKILIGTVERQLVELGYTEHGLRHVTLVSEAASRILRDLGYSERECELAKIAGYMHDIGNCVNRVDHAHSGAILAYELLKEQLEDVLDTLTDREENVLRLRFGLDDGRTRTLEEVGKVFGVTRERIRQIEAKALRKLRHPSRSKRLKDFLE